MYKLAKLGRIIALKNVALRAISSQILKNPDVPELDFNYLSDSKNADKIALNVAIRKGIGDILHANELKKKLVSTETSSEHFNDILKEYVNELLKIPNRTHPDVEHISGDYKVIKTIGKEKSFDFKPREFQEITKRLNMVRTDQLGSVCGTRSYYILGELAELEHALVQYTLSNLLKRGFKLISVPDILDRSIIESCGMNTRGERTQVYSLEETKTNKDLCLAGTSEMAIAGFLANKVIPEEELPMKLATVSRCFRAETSSLLEEKGIYRVHHFTKVEMFAVTTPSLSESTHEDFRSIEEENFSLLGLHLRTLDMAPHELGSPAYRKYDVEAWMPGRKIFGEVSSCSNCTDYQSRRLGIKYKNAAGEFHCHTLNGTACAIPRMLIALIETYQNDNGTIDIPDVLQQFMRRKTKMARQKKIPELKLIKNKKEHKK